MPGLNFIYPSLFASSLTRGWADSYDSFTKTMIHANGADAATVIGDEMGHIWTAQGNAQIDTAQFKFGVSSMLFDGTGDYYTSPDHADWFMSTGDFTIECFIRENSLAALDTIFSQTTDATNNVVLNVSTAGVITFTITATVPVVTMASASGVITTGTWYHIAVVRSSNNWNIYVNGTSVASTTDSDAWADYTGTFQIGANAGASGFNGWIDEFRISKGIARYTANFTAPTVEFGIYNYILDDSFTKLLLHFDGVADGSQAFYDEAQKILQPNGDIQLDTAQSKFGGYSGLFDGTGDYLTGTDSADFDFAADFTIDFWVRLNATGAIKSFYDGRASGSGSTTCPQIQISAANVIIFSVNGATQITGTTALTTGAWYHIALARSGTNTKLFLNGTQEGSTYTPDTTSYINETAAPVIGANGNTRTLQNFNGWIDELRVSKGIARWTTTFTPPTSAYS